MLKSVMLRRPARISAGHSRPATRKERPEARASSKSKALPALRPTVRMLQIGISLRASLTAGQLNPQDTAMSRSQALRLLEPLGGAGGSGKAERILRARRINSRKA